MRKKESIVKRVTELSREELESIVESIQGWMFVDLNPPDGPKNFNNCEVWNPEKDVNSEAAFHLKNVREILISYGLKPTKIGKFEG